MKGYFSLSKNNFILRKHPKYFNVKLNEKNPLFKNKVTHFLLSIQDINF